MKYLFLSLIFISLTIEEVYSQVFTIDIFAHTYYVNKNPGEILVKHKNWQDYVEYPGTGQNGYHSRYIYNLNNSTIEVLKLDSLGNIIPNSVSIEPVEIIFADKESFYVFNPLRELYSMFYLNDWRIPHLLIERVDGNGWFASDTDLELKIN